MFDLTGKNVYLSGPMSGIYDFNSAAFEEARRVCIQAGVSFVFNPCTAWGHTNHHNSWYMRHDLHRLTESAEGGRPLFDALIVLEGYEDSHGAMLETQVAAACGIAVVGVWELRKAAWSRRAYHD